MLAHDVDPEEVQSKLTDWIKEKMPRALNIDIFDMERSGAGFTNVSLSFTLSWQENGEQKKEGMLFRGPLCRPKESFYVDTRSYGNAGSS